MLDAYSEGGIDRVFLANNVFVNTMTQTPTISTLLPAETMDQAELQDNWDYIYEPDAAELLDGLLMRYIESQVYRAALENVASEMSARMVAMKSATENAGDIIDDLQLVVQQGAAGGDYAGTVGNCGWCCGRLGASVDPKLDRRYVVYFVGNHRAHQHGGCQLQMRKTS